MKNILKMNQSILKLFLIGLILCSATNIYSQENLNESEQNKISSAERKIEKAEAIVKKADKYNTEIEALKNDGKVRTGKMQRLETKANNIIIKSASYFKDGYGKKYGTYQGAVKRHIKNGSLETSFESEQIDAYKTYKTGRKWRRKSKSQGNVNKGVEYMLKANEVEGTAIESLIEILNHVDGNLQAQEPLTEETEDSSAIISNTLVTEPIAPVATEMPQDSILTMPSDSLNTDTTFIVSPVSADSVYTTPAMPDSLTASTNETVAIVTPVLEETVPITEPVTENAIAPKPTEELTTYFTIQFLADKQPVPKEKITSIYDGPIEVIRNEAEGWFRYSIGKYSDINEAKKALQSTGVNGYIVAYHNNNRISTREAIEILKGE